jgi:hypothetical protein
MAAQSFFNQQQRLHHENYRSVPLPPTDDTAPQQSYRSMATSRQKSSSAFSTTSQAAQQGNSNSAAPDKSHPFTSPQRDSFNPSPAFTRPDFQQEDSASEPSIALLNMDIARLITISKETEKLGDPETHKRVKALSDLQSLLQSQNLRSDQIPH